MDRDAASKRLRWLVCGLLFLATTINYLDRSALGLVEPMLKHILGGDFDPARYNRDYSDIVICFIVAYGVVRAFIAFIGRYGLKPFGWYRVVVGLLIGIALLAFR